MFFLPSVAHLVVNLCTYLPLWSGIMCSSFNYGDIPPSSAPIESQFNDLKNRVLKHVNSMPMRIDDFFKLHIQSLNGTMKLINSNMHQIRSSNYDNILHKDNSEKILPPPQNGDHSYTDIHFSNNSTTQTDTYENDNSTDESLSPVNSNTFKDNPFNQNSKIINIDYRGNTLLNSLNEDNETDVIRINDDLSNLDEILNSSSLSLDKNCCKNLDKPIQELHYSIDNITLDLNTIPLLENEDYSEENWGNILINPKKRNLYT